MFDITNLSSSGDWRRDRANLQKARKEIEQLVGEVPSLESYLSRKFTQARDRLAPTIQAQAVGEFRASIGAYQQAQKRMADAQRQEFSRWDLPRLHSEREAIKSMIGDIARSGNILAGDPSRAERLQKLYIELTSGPAERQRAALEVFAALPESGLLVGNDRHAVVPLAQRAKSELPGLRVTDLMLSADRELQAAQRDLISRRAELAGLAEEMGELSPFATSPLAQSLRAVVPGPDGSIELLDPGDPRMGGVVLKGVK